jgi:hypothetical protein
MTPPKRHFYILRRHKPFELRYDVVDSFIVCATSVNDARYIAAQQHAEEGAETWLNTQHSTCERIDPNRYDESCVILTDNRTR